MRIHIISIGGRIMHTLGISLKRKGHIVTGSDDEIYEPSKSKLESEKLLPEKLGWDKKRISEEIDLIILGMHARQDNPELIEAQRLGIQIISYPEFIFRASKTKKRVVIAGSHGKTTTTAMIMHVLKYRDFEFDYLIGAELEGFPSMIRLSDAPLIIIEGDEYLSSSIDRRPKMLHYQPDISVITGISWDHVNVFKTEKDYISLFEQFIKSHSKSSKIYAFADEGHLDDLVKKYIDLKEIEKYTPLEKLANSNVVFENKQYRIKVFGEHNRSNMMAALKVCLDLGITAPDFFAAISTFRGASKRMELMFESDDCIVYRDFAHAPSKVRATVQALKEHFPSKRIITFLELHTYSSLNKDFLPKYNGALKDADEAYVYYSEHTLEVKKMPIITIKEVRDAFGGKNIVVVNQKDELMQKLEDLELSNGVVVFMSSGNFDKIDVKGILIHK